MKWPGIVRSHVFSCKVKATFVVHVLAQDEMNLSFYISVVWTANVNRRCKRIVKSSSKCVSALRVLNREPFAKPLSHLLARNQTVSYAEPTTSLTLTSHTGLHSLSSTCSAEAEQISRSGARGHTGTHLFWNSNWHLWSALWSKTKQRRPVPKMGVEKEWKGRPCPLPVFLNFISCYWLFSRKIILSYFRSW